MDDFFIRLIALLALFYPIYSILMLIDRVIINSNSDKDLKIQTTGIREWERSKRKLYHRTESTPYLALNSLVKQKPFSDDELKSGDLVDFGSGRGRVAIYLHSQMNVNVTGVELHEPTYRLAMENMNNYKKHAIYSSKKRINFENVEAQSYKIKSKDNKFFFFNPFNSSIFEKTLENIKEDAIVNNKRVYVILYYKTTSYNKVMKSHSEFKKIKTIIPKGSIFYRERFTIYQL